MAFTITKVPDGDLNLGSRNGELVDLKPATSDYATGGYAIVDGVSVVDNPSLNANCDLYAIDTALPAGNQQQYSLVWQTATKKLEVWSGGSQVAANTDLSAFTFRLLLIGV